MKISPPVRCALASSVALGALAFLSSTALAGVPASCVKGVDLATLGPTSIVGQGPHGEKAASRRYAEAQRCRRREGEGWPLQGRHLDADRQPRLVAIAGAGHHRHAEEIWRLSHRRRVRRIPGRQADRGHREHDPAAPGRHHLDPGRFHRDGADLQEGVASGHQACVHGQHSDRARAPEGICHDGLGR